MSLRRKREKGPKRNYDFDASSARDRDIALIAAQITNAQMSANIWFKTPPPNLRAEDCSNVEEWIDKLYGANLARIRRESDPRRNKGYTRGSHLLFRG